MPLCSNDKNFLSPKVTMMYTQILEAKKSQTLMRPCLLRQVKFYLIFQLSVYSRSQKKKNTKMNAATNTFRKLSLR